MLILISIGAVAVAFVCLLCLRRYLMASDEGRYLVRLKNPSMVDRVNQIVAGAALDREHLEARADEIVRLHGYSNGSCEAETLEAVVWDGMPYEEAIQTVMKLRRERLS